MSRNAPPKSAPVRFTRRTSNRVVACGLEFTDRRSIAFKTTNSGVFNVALFETRRENYTSTLQPNKHQPA